MTKLTNPGDLRFVFFGTPDLAVRVLEELENARFLPALVVTAPDRPRGRGHEMQPTPVKAWALAHGIDTIEPEKITQDVLDDLANTPWDVFIVAMYGKILPKRLLDLPKHGTLNVHPSLLPKLRGASPIRSAILTDQRDAVGVSVMLLDEQMDHGPIVAQASIELDEWPAHGVMLDDLLPRSGGALLAEVLPQWIAGEIIPAQQNHSEATFCTKFETKDALIDLSTDTYQNLLKIRGFEETPGAYTFFERNGKTLRVRIIDAHRENNTLVLDIVKPEGKNEMPYADFARSGATPLTGEQLRQA